MSKSLIDRFSELQRYGEEDNGASGDVWMAKADDGEYLLREDVRDLARRIDEDGQRERDELLAALKALAGECSNLEDELESERGGLASSAVLASTRALIARIEGGNG